MKYNSPEYLALVEFMSSRNWTHFLTFTNKTHIPADRFFARVEKLQARLARAYEIKMFWFGSVEQTKNNVNHAHILASIPYADGHLNLKLNAQILPSNWRARQSSPGVANYLYNILGRPRDRKAELSTRLIINEVIEVAYRANYGAICDVQPIKSSAGAVSYALKYALKDEGLAWQVSAKKISVRGEQMDTNHKEKPGDDSRKSCIS